MIDQKTMLNIIATEAIENYQCPKRKEQKGQEKEAAIEYPLRLVKHADGTYTWED